MDFMIPLSDPLPAQVVVRVVSDLWIGSETVHAVSFQHLIRPSNETIKTDLLRLQPLPVTALHNPDVEKYIHPNLNISTPCKQWFSIPCTTPIQVYLLDLPPGQVKPWLQNWPFGMLSTSSRCQKWFILLL